jgi:hypothetical protein
MVWTAQDVRKKLERELAWSKENRDKVDFPDEYKDGFIAGLEQAIRAINELLIMR